MAALMQRCAVDVVILVNFLRTEVILWHSGCSIFVTTALGIIRQVNNMHVQRTN